MESDCLRGWYAFKISEKANETARWEYSYTLFIDNARYIILKMPLEFKNKGSKQIKLLKSTNSCFKVNFQ